MAYYKILLSDWQAFEDEQKRYKIALQAIIDLDWAVWTASDVLWKAQQIAAKALSDKPA